MQSLLFSYDKMYFHYKSAFIMKQYVPFIEISLESSFHEEAEIDIYSPPFPLRIFLVLRIENSMPCISQCIWIMKFQYFSTEQGKKAFSNRELVYMWHFERIIFLKVGDYISYFCNKNCLFKNIYFAFFNIFTKIVLKLYIYPLYSN